MTIRTWTPYLFVATVGCGTGAFGSAASELEDMPLLGHSSLTFASQAPGTTSAPQPVVVKNTHAKKTITLTQVATAAPFAVPRLAAPVRLGPGQSTTVYVTFSPPAPGTYDGTLVCTISKAPSQTIPLQGVSVAVATDTTPPVLSAGAPSGVLPAGTTAVAMTVSTNEAATCKWDTVAGTSFASMRNTFSTTGGTAHRTTLSGLVDGQGYSCFLRCRDAAGNANSASYTVSFSVQVRTLGSVTLSWEAPLTYSDGTPFTDLGGYQVHFGNASGSYSAVDDVGMATCAAVGGVTTCNYTVSSLGAARWYFVVTAYNTSGQDSDYSNEVLTDVL